MDYDSSPILQHLADQFDYETIGANLRTGPRWLLLSGVVRTARQPNALVFAKLAGGEVDGDLADEMAWDDFSTRAPSFGDATDDTKLFAAVERFYERNKRRKDKGASRFGAFLRGRGDKQTRDAWSTLYWIVEEY